MTRSAHRSLLVSVTVVAWLCWVSGWPSAAPAAASSGAAPSEPRPEKDSGGAAGLLSDVERIVDAEEDSPWFTDSHAYESLMPDLLSSVCRASTGARLEALAIAHERRRSARDARALFADSGELTGEVQEALRAEHEHEALRMAVEIAPTECPFWVRQQFGFAGRQTTRKRFALSVETGGIAQLRIAQGDVHPGGGGAGRLLGSFRFESDLTLLGGLEFGGGAMVRPETSASEFVINYLPAVPVVVRLHSVAWHYEIETAAVGLLQADNARPSYGVRLGVGVGLSALRVRSIIPWAGFIIAGEHYFRGGGRPQQQFLRAGLRVGLFWDPD